VEAYALDRDDLDLYGTHVAIDFTDRLRGTVRFDSVDALVDQMRHDVDQAREILVGRHSDLRTGVRYRPSESGPPARRAAGATASTTAGRRGGLRGVAPPG